MTPFEAVFLGVLQGITEFLPISSSGHLVLAEYFLGLSETSLSFDVALHVGTLVSVLTYFWKDWWKMAGSFVRHGDEAVAYRKLFFFLIAGTIPGALAGFFLEGFVGTVFRSPWVVVATLSSVAFLLYLGERLARHERGFKSVGLRDAIIVGCAQAVAIIPGVSRSGITMTAGLLLGFERTAAARFSFLLSAPIIAGAGFYQFIKLMDGEAGVWGPEYIWGFLSSVISGYLVIAFLMRYLVSHTFYPFVWYRLVLAAGVAVILVLAV